MELRQLRYFLAVADDLHFTKAAQRMRVAQPALSAQVRSLEREVGVPLLDRTTRNVSLTEVGAVLAADARELVRAADDALANARAVARRQAATVAVGCLGAAPGDLLGKVLHQLSATHPDARVEVHTFDFAQVRATFTEGRADLAFAYLPLAPEQLEGLEAVPLLDEPRVVVLSRSHPLAECPELRPAELAGEVFVSHSDAVPAAWRDFWLLSEQLGDRPAVHEHAADSLDEWLHLIARGEGIDTCPEFVQSYYAWPSVRYVPLRDAPPATLVLLRRAQGRSPLIDAFVEIVLRVAAAHPRARR